MKAYRIHIGDKVYGKEYLDLNTKRMIEKGQVIEIKNRPYLKDGMLYVPELDVIIDESERYEINRKLNELTMIETDCGHRLKHLNEMTREERSLMFDLQDEYDNFFKKEIKFVPYGKELEYFESLKKR
ncbi:MAG: hypothetical protein PUC68_03585 [Firmicutes bacterium]|nr:hypothetical protein [Bacillota bacterium]